MEVEFGCKLGHIAGKVVDFVAFLGRHSKTSQVVWNGDTALSPFQWNGTGPRSIQKIIEGPCDNHYQRSANSVRDGLKIYRDRERGRWER